MYGMDGELCWEEPVAGGVESAAAARSLGTAQPRCCWGHPSQKHPSPKHPSLPLDTRLGPANAELDRVPAKPAVQLRAQAVNWTKLLKSFFLSPREADMCFTAFHHVG